MDSVSLASDEVGVQLSTPDRENTLRVLLSVEEAADRLSLSRTRVYALIKAGDIESVRVGRLRRIPATALPEFAARLLAEQAPDRGTAA